MSPRVGVLGSTMAGTRSSCCPVFRDFCGFEKLGFFILMNETDQQRIRTVTMNSNTLTLCIILTSQTSPSTQGDHSDKTYLAS